MGGGDGRNRSATSADEEDEEGYVSDDDEEGEGEGVKLTLWPTLGVRNRWRNSLILAHTVGDGMVLDTCILVYIRILFT